MCVITITNQFSFLQLGILQLGVFSLCKWSKLLWKCMESTLLHFKIWKLGPRLYEYVHNCVYDRDIINIPGYGVLHQQEKTYRALCEVPWLVDKRIGKGLIKIIFTNKEVVNQMIYKLLNYFTARTKQCFFIFTEKMEQWRSWICSRSP